MLYTIDVSLCVAPMVWNTGWETWHESWERDMIGVAASTAKSTKNTENHYN